MTDFVSVIQGITTFVQNERTAAYNEGVDLLLNSTRDWMRMHDIAPKGDNMPDLLDEIEAALSSTDSLGAK